MAQSPSYLFFSLLHTSLLFPCLGIFPECKLCGGVDFGHVPFFLAAKKSEAGWTIDSQGRLGVFPECKLCGGVDFGHVPLYNEE